MVKRKICFRRVPDDTDTTTQRCLAFAIARRAKKPRGRPPSQKNLLICFIR
jgi:hypothetical protein